MLETVIKKYIYISLKQHQLLWTVPWMAHKKCVKKSKMVGNEAFFYHGDQKLKSIHMIIAGKV
jgi:hypothetical protein